MDFLKLICRDVQPQDGGGTSNDNTQNNYTTQDNNSGSTATEETPSWVDVLPDEAKQDPNITKFKTPDEFYKSYKNQTELVGRKGVILPKEGAQPEEMDKFYNALGRPEKPEGYKFEPIKDLDPSLQWTGESDAGLAKVLFDRGLTQRQAADIRGIFLNGLNQSARDQQAKDIAAAKTAETALRQEWGGEYDSNLNRVIRGLKSAGGEDVINAMGGERGLGNNPIVLKTLGKIMKGVSEDTMKAFESGNSSGARGGNETKQEAMNKIQAMMNDPNHPINDEKSPKRAEALKERMRLYDIAYPEGEQ